MNRPLALTALLIAASSALADQPAPVGDDVLAALHLKSARVVDLHTTPDQHLTIDLGSAQAPRLVTFTLSPYPLRAPNFKLIVSSEKGDVETLPPPPSTFHATDPVSGDELWACIVGSYIRDSII